MKKPSILIIEDDAWLVENYIRLLGGDYKIRHCNNGYTAIDMIDDHRPNAIILDVLLTGASAFALLHELQSYDDTGGIPIILCTNIAEDIKLSNLDSYGVVKVLNKATMTPSDVIAILKGIL